MQSYQLTYERRPWLINAERSSGMGGHYGRARLTQEWRTQFAQLCAVQKVRPMLWVLVEVLQVCATNRLPDPGACLPAAKAAIDGLVDAGVIPDDNGRYLHRLSFDPPVNLGYDALVLRISGPLCDGPERERRELVAQAKLLRQLSRR
jgi:hypothetical protein